MESEVRDLGFDDLLRENIGALERFVYYRIGNPEDADVITNHLSLKKSNSSLSSVGRG